MNQENHSSKLEDQRTKDLEKRIKKLERIIDMTMKTREHDKKFGKYEMM